MSSGTGMTDREHPVLSKYEGRWNHPAAFVLSEERQTELLLHNTTLTTALKFFLNDWPSDRKRESEAPII
jgi:hypothetical protein